MIFQQQNSGGCFCDEMEMMVEKTFGRDQYTANGKAQLIGTNEMNYATKQYGNWDSNSHYPGYPPHKVSSTTMFIWNNRGTKRLTWKSRVGQVQLQKVRFSPREDGPNWKDLPRKVKFTMKLNGLVVQTFVHNFALPKDKHSPLSWLFFPSPSVQRQPQQQPMMMMNPQFNMMQQPPMMNVPNTQGNLQMENQRLQQENMALKLELENLKKLVLNYADLLKQACQ